MKFKVKIFLFHPILILDHNLIVLLEKNIKISFFKRFEFILFISCLYFLQMIIFAGFIYKSLLMM